MAEPTIVPPDTTLASLDAQWRRALSWLSRLARASTLYHIVDGDTICHEIIVDGQLILISRNHRKKSRIRCVESHISNLIWRI